MASNLIKVLFAMLAIAAFIQGKSVPSPATACQESFSEGGNARHFRYIGSMSSDTSSKLRGNSVQAISHYFLSQNAVCKRAGYSTAASDCRAYLGDDATLLYIETQEELWNVTKLIRETDDTGSSYWVGGRYDPDKDTFVWESDVEVGPWAPWDQGHPNTRTPVTRVYIRTAGSLKLRTQFNTVSTRYICEMKEGEKEEEAEPCYTDNDLVIAVDSSGSIGEPHYMVALEFTTRLAIAWADNPNNRLSVIVYATGIRSILSLNQTLTVAQLRDLIYNAPYLNSSTNSHLALDMAVSEFQNNPKAVPQNLVFLTDGESTNRAATLVSAKNVQSAGIRSFSVGIGGRVNQTELLEIAGNNVDRVFNTDGFDGLLKLLQPVSRRVCEN